MLRVGGRVGSHCQTPARGWSCSPPKQRLIHGASAPPTPLPPALFRFGIPQGNAGVLAAAPCKDPIRVGMDGANPSGPELWASNSSHLGTMERSTMSAWPCTLREFVQWFFEAPFSSMISCHPNSPYITHTPATPGAAAMPTLLDVGCWHTELCLLLRAPALTAFASQHWCGDPA